MEMLLPISTETKTTLSVVREEESRIVELSTKKKKARHQKKQKKQIPSVSKYLMPEQPKGYIKPKDFDLL